MSTGNHASQTRNLVAPIEELDATGADTAELCSDLLTDYRPRVLRGLVSSWPAVEAARRSPLGFLDYLRRFDHGQNVKIVVGAPRIEGRLFYNDDLTGFNFERKVGRLGAVLDRLEALAGKETGASLAMQSAPVPDCLPGFDRHNRLSLPDREAVPRVWVGTRHRVAAHYDPQDNLACSVAGRRRFTLFPPEQVANLYVGPLDLTPAGAAISLVSPESPDFGRYPRFREALQHALTAELEPGDVLYMPPLWWHDVESLDPINALVNYWWDGSDAARQGGKQAFDSLLHALLCIRDLPGPQRAAWRALFDHYVFLENGDPGEHIPPPRRGILGLLDEPRRRQLKRYLLDKLRSM